MALEIAFLLGFGPPGLGFTRVVRMKILFTHRRTFEVGVSSLSAWVYGDPWSTWTFGEGLKQGFGPSGRVSCLRCGSDEKTES